MITEKIKSQRRTELVPYIIYIRDYDKMLNMDEEAYQKELAEIKIGAQQNLEYQYKKRQEALTTIDVKYNFLRNAAKQDLQDAAVHVYNSIVDGYLDPRETLVLSKKIQEFGKNIEALTRPIAEGVTVPVQKGGEIILGASVIEKAAPSKYDFSVCGDSTYDELIKEKERIDELIKKRETFLKTIPDEGVADTTSGEVINPPSITHGKQTLAVTLK